MKFMNKLGKQVGKIGTTMSKYKQSYGDQMIRTFIKSKFAKSKINTFVIMLCTIILRNMLTIIFCLAITTQNYYLDFFLHAFISILCLFSSTFIYDGLMGKKDKFYEITRFYINSFTPKRYRRWKRNIILPIALGTIIYTYIHEITSADIRYIILQSLLIYFIMDLIEHNKLQFISDYFYEMNTGPKLHIKKNVEIEHGFMTMDKQDYELRKRIKYKSQPNLPQNTHNPSKLHTFIRDTSEINSDLKDALVASTVIDNPTAKPTDTSSTSMSNIDETLANTKSLIKTVSDIDEMNGYCSQESEESDEINTDDELVSTYEDISTMLEDD
jgi:hypothetical protein